MAGPEKFNRQLGELRGGFTKITRQASCLWWATENLAESRILFISVLFHVIVHLSKLCSRDMTRRIGSLVVWKYLSDISRIPRVPQSRAIHGSETFVYNVSLQQNSSDSAKVTFFFGHNGSRLFRRRPIRYFN